MATVTVSKPKLTKAISPFGYLALGVGGIVGTSWLMVAGFWMETAGGPVNALLGWLLVAVLELPLVLAYSEAVPMLPNAGGEMEYSRRAFGRFGGFVAGWFGIIVNLIVSGYEIVALVRMMEFLFPSLSQIGVLYRVQGSSVSLTTILLGLLLVAVITTMHYRGVRISSTFQNTTTVSILTLSAIAVILGISLGDFSNFQPTFGKPTLAGVLAVVTMLPFSLAGWETIAKSGEEANVTGSWAGKALPIAWVIGWLSYVLTLFATAMVLPWQEGIKSTIPFATGLNTVTGSTIPGTLLIVAAIVGIVGVYNALFYACTRQIFAMSREGLLAPWLSKVHPTYQTPVNAIWLATGVIAIAAFIGRNGLIPLVDASSFSYIVLWGMTFFAVLRLRKSEPNLDRPTRMPGGLITVLGYVSIIFFAFAMLYPKSPGSLVWPLEYLVLLGLVGLGLLLYALRPAHTPESSQ